MTHLPRIAITMGDPAGVGPELCLRLVTDPRVLAVCVPIVIGDNALLRRVALRLDWPYPLAVATREAWAGAFEEVRSPVLVDLACLPAASKIEPGKVSA